MTSGRQVGDKWEKSGGKVGDRQCGTKRETKIGRQFGRQGGDKAKTQWKTQWETRFQGSRNPASPWARREK